MKKLMTIFTTAAIAFALSVPVFAKAPAKGKAASGNSATQSTSKHKKHKSHAKKGSKSKTAASGASK
jgi:hypothetical protein